MKGNIFISFLNRFYCTFSQSCYLHCIGYSIPHVVGAQLHRLSTVDAHTDVLKPIHGKII